MGIIRPEDALLDVISKSFDLITNELSRSIGCVYTVVEKRVEKIASCVFVRFHQNDYILTAAHVLTGNPDLPIVIGCSGSMAAFAGEFRVLRGELPLDVAIAKASPSLLEKLSGASFHDIGHAKSAEADWYPGRYVIFGYPNSKNKLISGMRSPLKRRPFGFMTGLAPEQTIAKRPDISARSHIVLDWTGTNVVLLGGERMNPPNPVGTSGGAVIDLGYLDNVDVLASQRPPAPTIVGIISEWPGKKFVVGVRLSETIRVFDQLRAWPP